MGKRAKRTQRKKRGGMRLSANAPSFVPPTDVQNQDPSSSLSSESSYGLGGPVVMPSTMRKDRNSRYETGPLGEKQLPQEVIRTIGDRASGLHPYFHEEKERAEAEKNNALSKIVDFTQRKYGPQGVALNNKYNRIIAEESNSSDYGQTIMKREAHGYFDRLEKEDDDIHKTLKLKEKELEVIESNLADVELVDFEICDNMFNTCYLNKDTLEECRRDGYEDKYLIPCKDRTQVYITTFTKRPNGLDEVKSMLTVLSDKEIDKMPVKEIADHFPGRIFTNAAKKVFYALLIGKRLCPNFVMNGEQMRPPLPQPTRRASGFRGSFSGRPGDRVCDLYDYFKMNPEKLLEFFGSFEIIIKDRRIHANKGDRQDEYIEKMKRFILLRLMNRDPYVINRLPYQLSDIRSQLESVVEDGQDDYDTLLGEINKMIRVVDSPDSIQFLGPEHPNLLNHIEGRKKILDKEKKQLNESKEVLNNIEGLLEQGWHPKIYVSNVGPKQALLSRDGYYGNSS
tara:strand:- start:2075 stop:3604 length:1530 start_codon:yes stop_codon:yes gene_type:complete